jgi:amidase
MLNVAAYFDGTEPGNQRYAVGPGTEPIGSVLVREPFEASTLDASGDQIRPGTSLDSVDPSRLFPVTGPVTVEGVFAGDTVGIEVLDLRLAPEAHCWTRPGIGLVRGDDYFAKRIATDSPAWRFPGVPAPGVPIRLAPHIGAAGVTPAETRAARDLGTYGGNLDVRALGSGATLWLVAEVDGGGIYLGDVHAGIGDGEVCGTGLEAAAVISARVHRRTDWTPALPTVSTGSRQWVVGVGESIEQAIAAVVAAMTSIIASELAITAAQARLLISQVLIIRICQVVNPRPSIVASLGGGLDRYLGPPAVAGASRASAAATARHGAPGRGLT